MLNTYCLYNLENNPDVLTFNFLHSRAQVESGSKLQLLIISTVILDSLENIRLRGENSQ